MALHEAVNSRWLGWAFFKRELSNRFSGTLLGASWAFVQPLALLAVYGFVFETVFRVKLPPALDVPYLLFVALGLWPWLAFSEGVSRGMAAVVANAALVKKVRFPAAWLVLAAVSGSFVLNVLGYALVMLALALLGHAVHWQGLLVVLAGLLGLWLLATGVALALAALFVFVRDVEYVVSHGLSLLFYLSPVLFSVAMVPAMIADWMWINPVTGLLEGIRAAWLSGNMAPSAAMWQSMGVGVAVLLVGWWMFKRLVPHFEEEL
ncbi:MAG TPA: ABC transporter permease [Burkholderiaceae bacterium]|nr:ABC transporter permease [Burkholderiaceae bacterium]